MNLKIGTKVNYTMQRGNRGSGKVKALPPAGANGRFIHVESTEGKLLKLRPVQVAAA